MALFASALFLCSPPFVSVNGCKFASTFMNRYAQEPWEGLEVAQASETGHFISGKGGRIWNTLATLIRQNVFFQGLTDHKSSTNHFIRFYFVFWFINNSCPNIIGCVLATRHLWPFGYLEVSSLLCKFQIWQLCTYLASRFTIQNIKFTWF